MYRPYFTAAAHFLTGRGILPEINEHKPRDEEDVARSEELTKTKIPAELRAFYLEMGDRFMFIPEVGHSGFGVSSHNESCWDASTFAQRLREDLQELSPSVQSGIDPKFLEAEAARRAHWFPFYNVGGGGYLLCLDTARDPSPVCYHEEGYWCGLLRSSRTFELAPSFTEFIRQWSRFCFSDPGCSMVTFCMNRHGAFDWNPSHFKAKYDRGTPDI